MGGELHNDELTDPKMRFLRREERLLAREFKGVLAMDLTRNESLSRQSEILTRYGHLYLERAEYTMVLEDFTKSSSLFNAARVRGLLCDENVEELDIILHQIFSKVLFATGKGDVENPTFEEWRHYRQHTQESLHKIRSSVEDLCNEIKVIWGRYETDLTRDERRELEDILIAKTRVLGSKTTGEMISLFDRIYNHCVTMRGEPPCPCALLGLGSLARQEATPYSDIEFAILIPELDGPKHDAAKAYYLDVASLFHLIILDLGETPLPAMAIQSLNDFYGTLDGEDWYYDDITPSGTKLDGAMPWACKTAMGRKQAGTVTKEPLQLIGSPRKLALYRTTDLALKEGYHLADVLGCAIHITGDERLTATFLEAANNQEYGAVARGIVGVISALGNPATPDSIAMENKLTNVKHEFYRVPSLLTSSFRDLYSIEKSAPWDIIDCMEQKGILTNEGARSLQLLNCTTYGMRVLTYTKQKEQNDSVSFLPGYDAGVTVRHSATKKKKEYHFEYKSILVTYFKIYVPLHEYLTSQYLTHNLQEPVQRMQCSFYDDDCKQTAAIFEMLGCFDEIAGVWKKYNRGNKVGVVYEGTITEGTALNLVYDLNISAESYSDQDKFAEAVHYYKQSLHVLDALYGKSGKDELYLVPLKGMVRGFEYQGEYDEAQNYADKYFNMLQQLYGGDIPFRHWLSHTHTQAKLYTAMGEYTLADQHYTMCVESLGRCPRTQPLKNYYLTMVYAGWAHLKRCLRDYRSAITCCDQAATSAELHYGQQCNHPIIAKIILEKVATEIESLDIRGQEQEERLDVAKDMFAKYPGSEYKSDHVTCLKELATLQAHQSKYFDSLATLDEAERICKDFCMPEIDIKIRKAEVLFRQGTPQLALPILEEANTVAHKMFGEREHPLKLQIGLNMGLSHYHLGNLKEALDCLHTALKENQTKRGDFKGHNLDILVTIASVLEDMNDNNKAIEFASQVIEAKDSVSEWNRRTLTCFVEAYTISAKAKTKMSSNDEARKFLVLAEEMLRSSESSNLPTLLRDIGSVYSELEDHTEALRLAQEQLKVSLELYGHHLAVEDQHREQWRIALAYSHLAFTLRHLGRNYDEVLTYFQKALDIWKELNANPYQKDQIADIYTSLGDTHILQGCLEEAKKYYKDSLAYRGPDTVCKDDPKKCDIVAQVLCALGEISFRQGSNDEADQYYQQSLCFTKSRPANLEQVLHIKKIAQAYQRMKKTSKALEIYKEAHALSQKLIGAGSHSGEVASLLHYMGVILRKL